jgi:hypothetical protein
VTDDPKRNVAGTETVLPETGAFAPRYFHTGGLDGPLKSASSSISQTVAPPKPAVSVICTCGVYPKATPCGPGLKNEKYTRYL